MTWPEPPNYYETPKGTFKVMLQQPQYPVIHPDPTLGQVAANVRPGMWAMTTGMSLLGAGLGYWKGTKSHWQRPSMYFGAVFFGKSGILISLTDSAYRLMGYRENAREVSRNVPGVIQREAY